MAVHIKTLDEIALMREAGRIVAIAHEEMRKAVRPGVSTWELDQIAEAVLRDHNAIPAFLGYPKQSAPDFPATITASINEELVHGIPSKKRVLKAGDIISLDVGCHYEGFVGDAARTWAVGEIDPAVQRLLDVTEEALNVAIAASVLPNNISDVARAVQTYVSKQGYSFARDYTGHGVGRNMHEEPQVPNWWPRGRKARRTKDTPLQVGMTYAIEPMVIMGRQDTQELDDGWTVVTKDGSLCAHVEHTIAITEDKPVILTLL